MNRKVSFFTNVDRNNARENACALLTCESNDKKDSPYTISLCKLILKNTTLPLRGSVLYRELAIAHTVFACPYRQLIQFTANQNIEFSTKEVKKEICA
jgi:hypothetical protein